MPTSGPPRGVAAAHNRGLGVVPIIRNDVLEGACGVNGGTTQQDEDCAYAGVARWKELAGARGSLHHGERVK